MNIVPYHSNRIYSMQRLVASPSAEAGCLPWPHVLGPAHSFRQSRDSQSLQYAPLAELWGRGFASPINSRVTPLPNAFFVVSCALPSVAVLLASLFYLWTIVYTLRPPHSTLCALYCTCSANVTSPSLPLNGNRKRKITKGGGLGADFGLALTSSDNPTR